MIFKLFPYTRTEEVINLPKSQVENRLSSFVQLEPYHWIFKNNKQKRLAGKLNNDVWKVFLKTSYQNGFKPEIRISIDFINETQTKLIFEFRLLLMARVFLVVWVSFILLMSLLEGFDSMEGFLTSLEMIGGAILITLIGYNIGLNHSIEFLKTVVAKIKEDGVIEGLEK